MNLTNTSDGGHVPCTKPEEPKSVENLPKGIQFCIDSGRYSTSLNLMSSWMNCVPEHPKRSVIKRPSSLSGVCGKYPCGLLEKPNKGLLG